MGEVWFDASYKGTNIQINTTYFGQGGLHDILCLAFHSLVLHCRVRLSKRRAKAGAQSTTNAVLVCKHRDMNEKELEAQVSPPPTLGPMFCLYCFCFV